MDMKRIRKQAQTAHEAEGDEEVIRFGSSNGKKKGAQVSIPVIGLFICFMLVTVVIVASGTRRSQSIVTIAGLGGGADVENSLFSRFGISQTEPQKDKYLNNLLSPNHSPKSCLSRYTSVHYRRTAPPNPSPHLVHKLRLQESLQKTCGPGTAPYTRAIQNLLRSGQRTNFDSESNCKYLVWIAYSGLGNRILTVASAFLYSLLTDRVLLIDRGKDMDDLFCEPFPETSWLLPVDFPLVNSFGNFTIESPQSYGNIFGGKNDVKNANFVYLHLDHNYGDNDKLFFCEEDQKSVRESQWLILRSDNYFVPSLFLNPIFKDELNRLFPNKEMVFHNLGRYLFHPTNAVWGLITRYYDSYLSKADEILGLQVRVFETHPGPYKHIMGQILSCTQSQNLLPKTTLHESQTTVTPNYRKSKAVLLTSLNFGYYEMLRTMYWENPTSTKETISIFQPSYEGYQQSEKKNHDRKAWAEIYLLSLSDNLITTGWSTFGYVANGLAGQRPWIMFRPENRTVPDPACRKAESVEPCFHAPPLYDCELKQGADTGKMVPHVRHCEDISWGIKLVERNEF
ncbi:hypothetical protein LUZ60_001266 [Juncus effusus]|nr:hypothetical protein LUZ60_001266 [Juncus effusus]